MIKRVNVIGAGNVGRHLAQQVAMHKNVVSIFSRTFEKARSISGMMDALPLSQVRNIPTDVDLNIVCIADDGIKDIVEKLPKHIPVVHTSGSVDISIFHGFETYGILYPLQTFSATRAVEMDRVPFLIEANNEKFQNDLIYFAQDCFSEMVEIVNSEKRKLIHLAAVISANFTNHLITEAKEILDDGDISFKILEPLMQEVVKKAFDLGPEIAQTGPAIRGDKNIITAHQTTLGDTEIGTIYRIITGLIIQKRKSLKT